MANLFVSVYLYLLRDCITSLITRMTISGISNVIERKESMREDYI